MGNLIFLGLFAAFVIAVAVAFNGMATHLKSGKPVDLFNPATLFDAGAFDDAGNRYRRWFLGLLAAGLLINLLVLGAGPRGS